MATESEDLGLIPSATRYSEKSGTGTASTEPREDKSRGT